MKKLIITTAILLGFGFTTFAGPNGGGLFQRGISDEEFYGMGYTNQLRDNDGPMLPNHGSSENEDAPLGTGIAVLTVLGGAYLVAKKRKEKA